MTLAFTMSIDASFMQQRLATESVTDYWVANVPGLPSNPLLRVNGVPSSPAPLGAFKDISAKVDSAAARLGSAVALRTKTVSRLIQGPGANMTTEQTSEVSNIQRTTVDPASLISSRGLPPHVDRRLAQNRTISSQARLKSSTCGRIASSSRGA